MAHEYKILFDDPIWFSSKLKTIEQFVLTLSTAKQSNDSAFWLKGTEEGNQGWDFDVRLFMDEGSIFIEQSAKPESVANDLGRLIDWLRERTEIAIVDEDGVFLEEGKIR